MKKMSEHGMARVMVAVLMAFIGIGGPACAAHWTVSSSSWRTQPFVPEGEVKQGADSKGEHEQPRHVLRGPVWALSWSAVPSDVRYITPMIWIERGTNPAAAARQSREVPAGRAALFLWLIDRDVANNLQDYVRTPDGMLTRIPGPWFDRGIRDVRQHLVKFFSEFQRAGGRADYLIIDFEISRSIWTFEADRREHILQAILNDPRGEVIRAGLKQRGMREADMDRIHDWRSARPRYRLGETSLGDVLIKDRPAYIIWNAYMRERMAEALNRAIFEPVKAFYPRVQASNYNYHDLTPENVVPDRNGHLQYHFGHFGTHGARSFYGSIGQLSIVQLFDGRKYGDAPFDVLRYEVNKVRAIRRSSETPMHAWVSYKSWEHSCFKDNSYYEELIYHLALCGVEDFLYWHPSRRGRSLTAAHHRDARELDRCLAQLNEWFDQRERRSVTLQEVPWTSSLIVSGMRIGDNQVLWRVTAPTGTKQIKVRETGDVLEITEGACGRWYESSQNHLTFEPIVDS